MKLQSFSVCIRLRNIISIFFFLPLGLALNGQNMTPTIVSDKGGACVNTNIGFNISVNDTNPITNTIEYYKFSVKKGTTIIDVFQVNRFTTQARKDYFFPEEGLLSILVEVEAKHKDSTSRFNSSNPIAIRSARKAAAAIMSVDQNNLLTCKKDTVFLKSTEQQQANDNLSYLWKKNNGTISGQNSVNYNATTQGDYALVVSNWVDVCVSDVSNKFTVGEDKSEPNVSFSSIPSGFRFCEGDQGTLSASGGGTYKWNTGETTAAINVKLTGSSSANYTVTATHSVTGCTTIRSQSVQSVARPTLSITTKKYTFPADTNVSIEFTTDIIWQATAATNLVSGYPTSNTSNKITGIFKIENPRTAASIRYALQAKGSVSGCDGARDTISVYITSTDNELFIPEILSPNGDGRNDTWQVGFKITTDADKHSVIIYNRSGGKVYESATMSTPWDPEKCPDGVYYYLIQNKESGKNYKGAVTVIR